MHSRASLATHGGCLAHLLHLCQGFLQICRRILRHADLPVTSGSTKTHSRTACWPFMGLGLLLDPPVWVSHTTSHLVEAEEAPFAVTRDPVMLPNI